MPILSLSTTNSTCDTRKSDNEGILSLLLAGTVVLVFPLGNRGLCCFQPCTLCLYAQQKAHGIQGEVTMNLYKDDLPSRTVDTKYPASWNPSLLMMQEPLNLTIGVELEFLLTYVRTPELNERLKLYPALTVAETNLEHNRERQKIVDHLRHLGLPVNDIDSKDYAQWTVETDGSVHEPVWDEYDPIGNANLPTRIVFANGRHTDLTPGGRRLVRFCPVEMVSPARAFNMAALEEVQTAVRAIVAQFPVFTNESCGLHVHIGNQDKGFPLQTLKNFSTLTTSFERQVNQIHPRDRLDSMFCHLETTAFEPSEREPWRMAFIINELPDIESYIRMFGTMRDDRSIFDHNWCYNVNNLGLQQSKRTIEFRQHTGTLDPHRVILWAIFAASIVSLAHNTESSAFWNLMIEFADDVDFTVLDLLRKLFLIVLADEYEGRIFQHSIDLPVFDSFECDENDWDATEFMQIL